MDNLLPLWPSSWLLTKPSSLTRLVLSPREEGRRKSVPAPLSSLSLPLSKYPLLLDLTLEVLTGGVGGTQEDDFVDEALAFSFLFTPALLGTGGLTNCCCCSFVVVVVTVDVGLGGGGGALDSFSLLVRVRVSKSALILSVSASIRLATLAPVLTAVPPPPSSPLPLTLTVVTPPEVNVEDFDDEEDEEDLSAKLDFGEQSCELHSSSMSTPPFTSLSILANFLLCLLSAATSMSLCSAASSLLLIADSSLARSFSVVA